MLKRIIVFIAFLKYALVISQGIPPVKNFSPSDYHGENQNWGISQSKYKHIYIANSNGLLEYNGSIWKRYPSPNETILRSVEVIDDKIFTGCYMEFGYWEKDEFGSLRYTSLSDKHNFDLLPDEEFWRIVKMDDWVVFQSLKRLYVYNLVNDTVYTIDNPTLLPNITLIDQTIYYYKNEVGIFKIDGGQELLVFDNMALEEDEVVGIFKKGEELLILTSHHGFYRSVDETLVKWQTDADELLSQVSIYTSLQLRDQGFAIGTISNGFLHLDQEGNLLNHITQSRGLRNNTVLSLREDQDGNIWMGLDNGVSYADLKAPYLVYHDNQGMVGSVYASAVFNGILYLGTNQGLYYKNPDSDSDFKLIPGTQGQVWSLNNIDQTLFCGHHTGTFVIEGNRAKRITTVSGSWKIAKYEDNSELLLQGNYDGLYLLEKRDGTWQMRNKLEGFDHSAKSFEVFSDHIFVNHEYKGIFKIKPDKGLQKALEVTVDTLHIGHNSGLISHQDDLLYAYKDGVYKYDRKQDEFQLDSLLSLAYSKDEYISGRMATDSTNNYLWFFTDPGISYVSGGKLDSRPKINKITIPQDLRNGIIGYESIAQSPKKNTYLLGTSTGFISLDLKETSNSEFKVYIGSAHKINRVDGGIEKSELKLSETADLGNTENHLQISFNAPEYEVFSVPEFQYQLQGSYDGWSEWSDMSVVRFENLSPGDYTFNVRARIGEQISSNTASYAFSIGRPWYISNLMLIVYAVLGAIIFIIVNRLYRRQHKKQLVKLIANNKRELELAKLANEKEVIRIKNEQLKAENKRKSKELAASTMNLVRKNELLSRIKGHIMENFEKRESKMPLINIIDKSLNKNDDWEMFKEAFNNADQKFLKKLKKIHPNLSPNDIKLCAYLRLNLSSKEIAPLLNISVRSVEIKRYRLRKKLGLIPEDNLVNYILEL